MKRIAALLFLCSVFVSGCTNSGWIRTSVEKQYDFNVALEHYREKGVIADMGFDHPYEIEVHHLRNLLEGLRYTEKGGLMGTEEQNPVFQESEIDRLAPAISEALAKADSGQRIRFISFNQAKAWMFSIPRKTEGVLFIKPASRLNIAFNSINAKRGGGETSAVNPIYSGADALGIKDSETTLSATSPYAGLHMFDTGQSAPMWIEADLEMLKKSTSDVPASVVDTRKETAPEVTPEVDMEGTPVERARPGKPPEQVLKEDLKSKLKFLKELLDEGLITEQDYTAKKRQLLDKID